MRMQADNLQDFRTNLDNIDRALVYLLAERFFVTHKVGLYKKSNGLPAVDAKREQAILADVRSRAENSGLDPEFAERLFRLIMDEVVKDHKLL